MPESPRRRSILNRVAALRPQNQIDNDDEAERAELLAADRSKASSQFSTPSRRSDVTIDLSSSPQKEHFQGCLKLYAENKINKDNAWNLQLIDFMSAMIRKHDSRMQNLQMATTTLDASARIYSFRVDAIHNDVLKMAGGLSKAVQEKRGRKADDDGENNQGENQGEDAPRKKEKKKRAAKGSLATNVENQLNTEIEINECIDAFFAQLSATTGDMTSAKKAFNNTLPVGDEDYGIILRSESLFLDMKSTDEETLDVNNLEMTDKGNTFVTVFDKNDPICETFNGFSILNWSPEEEEENMRNAFTNKWVDNLNSSQQAMAFDMDADVEPLPADSVLNNFAMAGDDFQNVVDSDEEDMGVTNQAIQKDHIKHIVQLTDMRPLAQGDGFLEYSYSNVITGAWAGPSHWKLKNNINKMARPFDKTQTVTTVLVKKGPSRKKKQLDYLNEGMTFNRKAQECPDYLSVVPAKIMINRKTLSQGTMWCKKNFMTPIDRGLNIVHFKKLYNKQTVMLSLLNGDKDNNNKNDEVAKITDYDYNNDHDTSYCPNSQLDNDGGDWQGDDCDREGDVHNHIGAVDDNCMEMVEPPPKVAKIFIPYALRAKRVDMKQLKSVTWKFLTCQYDLNTGAEIPNVAVVETVKPIGFNHLMNRLPTKLSTNMREALSTSLSLLSVLHLANEKGLYLENNADYTDFTILPVRE